MTLINDFHKTSVTLHSTGQLTPRQVGRAKRELCGVEGCTCSGELGMRGPQPWMLAEPIQPNHGALLIHREGETR